MLVVLLLEVFHFRVTFSCYLSLQTHEWTLSRMFFVALFFHMFCFFVFLYMCFLEDSVAWQMLFVIVVPSVLYNWKCISYPRAFFIWYFFPIFPLSASCLVTMPLSIVVMSTFLYICLLINNPVVETIFCEHFAITTMMSKINLFCHRKISLIICICGYVGTCHLAILL